MTSNLLKSNYIRLIFKFPLYSLCSFKDYYLIGGGGGINFGVPNKVIIIKKVEKDSLEICNEILTDFPVKSIAIQPSENDSNQNSFKFVIAMHDFCKIYSFENGIITCLQNEVKIEFDASSFLKQETLCFFKNGKQLVNGGGDSKLRIWSFPEMTNTINIPIEDESETITEISIDSTRNHIIVCTASKWTIWQLSLESKGIIWQLSLESKGKILQKFILNEKWNDSSLILKGCVFSHTGDIYVGTIAPKKSGWISHWRISDEKSCVKWNLAHTSRIHSSYHHTCLAISPNGQYLATGTVENTIAIFDLTFSKLMEVKRHTSFITKIMFSEDSKIILSVAADSSFVCQKIEDKRLQIDPIWQTTLIAIIAIIFTCYFYLK